MDVTNYKPLCEFAARLADEAAAMALPRIGEAPSGRKADNSVVTDTDHAIQAHILAAVAREYPDHAVISEETIRRPNAHANHDQARYCWVIDPIDGTRNFVAGFPCFATSIAVLDRGRPVAAAVREHNTKALYTASLGDGAAINQRPIRVRVPLPGEDWLVGGPSSKDVLTTRVLEKWIHTRGLIYRNVGSSAVHLAWVASGALVAAFAKRCKIWDIAAGMLLVSEAGGSVTGVLGQNLLPLDLSAPPDTDIPFLAAEPAAHARLLNLIRPLADGAPSHQGTGTM